MSRKLNIHCPACGERSDIRNINHMNSTDAEFTCSCSFCGHVVVWKREFAHASRGGEASKTQVIDSPTHLQQNRKTMGVICPHCESAANVTKTFKDHPQIYSIYCKCKNENCKYRFVLSLSVIRTLVLSSLEINRMVQDLVSSTPNAAHSELAQTLSNINAL